MSGGRLNCVLSDAIDQRQDRLADVVGKLSPGADDTDQIGVVFVNTGPAGGIDRIAAQRNVLLFNILRVTGARLWIWGPGFESPLSPLGWKGRRPLVLQGVPALFVRLHRVNACPDSVSVRLSHRPLAEKPDLVNPLALRLD